MKKVISLLLVVVMTLTLAAPAYAAENTSYTADDENVIYLDDNSTLESATMPNGDVYFWQYVDGQLLEEAFLAHGSSEVVSTRYENGEKEVKVLNVNECLEVHVQNNYAVAANSLTTLGRIVFEDSYGEHTARVQYSSEFVGTTTYTIQSGVYTVVQLAGILVGGLSISRLAAEAVAAKIFSWLGFGLTVTGTFLGNETYSAELTNYTYLLTDIASGYQNRLYSEKYKIVDVYYTRNTETYWEGFNPLTCWRDYSFATEVYWHLYGDAVWSLVRWA